MATEFLVLGWRISRVRSSADLFARIILRSKSTSSRCRASISPARRPVIHATVMHNPSPECLEELERCKKAVIPVSGPRRPGPSEGQGPFPFLS